MRKFLEVSHHCSRLKLSGLSLPHFHPVINGGTRCVHDRVWANGTSHLSSKYRKASTSFSNFSKADWILLFYVVIREKAFYSVVVPPNRKHRQYQKTNPKWLPLYILFLTHSQQTDLNVKHFPKKHAMLLRFRRKFVFSVLQTREFLKHKINSFHVQHNKYTGFSDTRPSVLSWTHASEWDSSPQRPALRSCCLETPEPGVPVRRWEVHRLSVQWRLGWRADPSLQIDWTRLTCLGYHCWGLVKKKDIEEIQLFAIFLYCFSDFWHRCSLLKLADIHCVPLTTNWKCKHRKRVLSLNSVSGGMLTRITWEAVSSGDL